MGIGGSFLKSQEFLIDENIKKDSIRSGEIPCSYSSKISATKPLNARIKGSENVSNIVFYGSRKCLVVGM